MLETSGVLVCAKTYFKMTFGATGNGYVQIKKRKIKLSVLVSEMGSEKYVTTPRSTDASIPASIYSPGRALAVESQIPRTVWYNFDAVMVRSMRAAYCDFED